MRQRTLLPLACCAAGLIAGSLGAALPASRARPVAVFTGRVTDVGGRPVPGASVYAALYNSLRSPRDGNQEPTVAGTTADSTGAFRLPVPIQGEGWLAHLSAASGGQGPGGRMISEGMNTTGLTLSLTRPSFVAGQVTDRDGRPIAGVSVRVQWAQRPDDEISPLPPEKARPPVVTDVEGRFRIAPLPAGSRLTLVAEHPRYARWYGGFDIQSGREDAAIRMSPAGTIVGRVIYEDGRPAVNVRLNCWAGPNWREAMTRADGSFRLGNLPGGDCVASVALDDALAGYFAEPRGVVLRDGEEARCPDLRLVRLIHSGLVTGRVVNRQKQPVADVGILAMRQVSVKDVPVQITVEPMTRTAADGTYRLRLPPGSWRVVPKFPPAAYARDVSWDNSPALPVEAGRMVRSDFRLDRAVRLRGRVLDAAGRPAAGATVRRAGGGWSNEQPCDAGGRFRYGGLRPGQALGLTVFSRDGSQGAVVEAAPARVRGELVVRLRRLPALTGVVTDTGGLPLRGAWVRADRMVPIGGGMGGRRPIAVAKTTTDARGRFALGLFPGSQYRVTASTPGYGAIDRFPVRPERMRGKPTRGEPLRFTLARSDGVIAGLVIDPDGRPLAGARVSAGSTGATNVVLSGAETVSDAAGRFQLRRLPPGDYHVHAELPGYQGDFRQRVAVGQANVRLLLAPTEEPASPATPVGVGARAPDLSIARWVNGEGISDWGALRGKTVVLQFSSAFNAAARASNEALKSLHAALRVAGRTDVVILAIYDRSAPAEEVASYAQAEGLPIPIGLVEQTRNLGADSETFRAYGVRRLPTVFVIDQEGIVRAVDPAPGELARLTR